MAIKVKMLVSIPASDDGIVTQLYKCGHIYDVSDKLAGIFFKGEDDTIFAERVIEEKMLNSTPENKEMFPKEVNVDVAEKEEDVADIIDKGFGKKIKRGGK